MEEEVWASKKGTLSFTILVLDDEERLKDILSEKEEKSSNLEFDVIWRDNVDAHSNISITRLRDIELDVSDVFREINSDEPSRQVQQLQRWVKGTQSEIMQIFS
jgi:hypothetical protein